MKKLISCLLIIIILIAAFLAYFWFIKPKDDNQDLGGRIKDFVSDDEKFTFAVISDSERKDDNLNKKYKQAIKQINQSDAEFLVHLGDSVHFGNNKEFAEFKNYMDKNLDIPYYIVPGNHDILADEAGKGVFLKYFTDLYDSWDHKDSHFVVLDNSWNLEGFSDQQLNWLKKDLAENQNPVYIFMHRPTKIPYEDLYEINDAGTKQSFASYEKFYEIINKPENNVKEVYSGHIHMHFPFNLKSIPMTIVGSSGSEPRYDFMKNDESYYHYFEVEVNGDEHVNSLVEIE